MLRTVVAGTVVLCGIGLSILQLIQHHWISAAVYVVAGALTGILIALGGSSHARYPAIVTGFTFVGALGLVAVFGENRLFQTGRTEVLAEGVEVFARLHPLQCQLASSRVRYLQEAGVKACAMQGTHDQLDAVQALNRAHMIPPVLAVPDGLFQALQKDKPDPCIDLLLEVQKACPGVFPINLGTKLAAIRR
ncbi:hypothetical protein [Pseudoduganella sp. GCM10020061]|uniref:hypothetical protein n=1 Tax=Pseudoduganella sp. GCM10020061 TaxID=3317345 RepID=UPI003635DE4F